MTLADSEDRAGNTRPPLPLTSACSKRFSPNWTQRLGRCCFLRQAPQPPIPGCRTRSTASCCSADFGYRSRLPRGAALVVEAWTSTGPPLRMRASWCAGQESRPPRICREAGARVAVHVALRDLNLDVPAADGRRIEVVANGLPIWQGAQIAVDATIVSPMRRDGQPRPRADHEPGLALNQAVDRKHRTYPEFQQARRRGLVVVGVEVGGRISRPTLEGAVVCSRGEASADAGAGRRWHLSPPCARTPARFSSCPSWGLVTRLTATRFRSGSFWQATCRQQAVRASLRAPTPGHLTAGG